MSHTIALCNQKGGVGKTTTTYHLARAAIVAGMKVLTIDMDPQGNLTTALARDYLNEDTPDIASVLTTRTPLPMSHVIKPGLWEGLDLVPCVADTLAFVRDELVVAGAGRERRLSKALAEVKTGYDLILIDCPPSLDQLTINALTAADATLIITTARQWSANGLVHLLDTMDQVTEAYNPTLKCAGIIINAVEASTKSSRHWQDELDQAARSANLRVFMPAIAKRVLIADVTERSQGLDEQGALGTELAAIYTTYLETLLPHSTR